MDRDYPKEPRDTDLDEVRVDRQRNCLGCDYHLAGLGASGRCPECGIPFGSSLVLVGYRSPVGSLLELVGGLVMVALSLLIVLAQGPLGVVSLVSMGATALYLARVRRRWMARLRHGGDLKWVVDARGINVIEAERKNSSKRELLLPWSSIRAVRSKASVGLRRRRWRGLGVRRTFMSMDVARRRAMPIWFPRMLRREIESQGEQVESMRRGTDPA